MSINISQDINDPLEKHEPKVKIGKDIFIYRTLYLITNEELFKDKLKKNINFYLKSNIKQKSLLYLPKPQDSDIIIEEIKELIELALSLCILTNSANYKISIFTSSFGNIENNTQLLKYQGKILYAKLNELRKDDNEEKNNSKILEYNEQIKKDNVRKSYLRKKSNTIKEFPSIKLKQIFPYKKFGNTILNNKDKKKEKNSNDLENSSNQEKDFIINEDSNYIHKNNSYINIFNNNYNMIPHLPNLVNYNNIYNNNSNIYDDSSYREKIINSRSLNFQDKLNPTQNNNFYNSNQKNNQFNNFSKTKSLVKNVESNLFYPNNQLGRSSSYKNFNSLYNNPKKYFWRTLHKNNSFHFYDNNLPSNIYYNKNGTDINETNYTYININMDINTNTNIGLLKRRKGRNKIIYKTKYFSPFRFSYFSKGNTENNNNFTNYKKIKNLFTKKSNTSLIDNEKKNKEILANQQNVKLIQNFLLKPSIITLTKNNFYDPKQSRFSSVKNIYNEFKNALKNISYKLNNYVANKEIEIYIEIDTIFKSMGIDLIYCLKEYCLYSYFDKYIKDNYPSILENFLYDTNITATQISEVLNSLIIHIHKFKHEERFNLVDYVRSLKTLKNFKLSSDFFEIFVLCPNYFELTKREVTKKISLVLEIDCVTNNVTVENFINYYYIFRYGHLVKLEKKLLFINKLLHMIEGKGSPLQEKIFSDIQYLFRIDNRTKQMLLGRPYEIKINFHTTLKINQIFNSIIDYFNEKNNKNVGGLNFTQINTSNCKKKKKK